MTFRYCPRCATELEMRDSAPPDPPRPTCPNCDWVQYVNPTPTVQAWIDDDGRFHALERNQEPLKGRWNLPGGFVEPDESGPEAIMREVREETGLEIEVVENIGIFSSTYGEGEDEKPILDIAYLCRRTGGVLEISDESGEHGTFTLDRVPRARVRGRAQGTRGPARRSRRSL